MGPASVSNRQRPEICVQSRRWNWPTVSAVMYRYLPTADMPRGRRLALKLIIRFLSVASIRRPVLVSLMEIGQTFATQMLLSLRRTSGGDWRLYVCLNCLIFFDVVAVGLLLPNTDA